MKNENAWYWIKFILLFIWQLPQNLVALIMFIFMGKSKHLGRKRYCNYYYCQTMVGQGSISLGSFIFLGTDRDTTIGHELGHVVDSHWMGPLYLLIIGLPSLIWAALFKSGNYYEFYTESRANKHSHLHAEPNTYIPKDWWHLVWDEGYSLENIE